MFHPMRLFLSLIVVLAFASVVVGCGGSSDDSNSSSAQPTSESLTKAEFIKQGDAICKATDEKQKAVLNAYLKKEKPEISSKEAEEALQIKMVEAAGLPPIQAEAEELGELEAPSGDEAEIAAIVAGIEEAAEKAKEDPTSLLEGAPKGPFTDVDKLATEYGFKACNNAL
jgi:hypothetical protein